MQPSDHEVAQLDKGPIVTVTIEHPTTRVPSGEGARHAATKLKCYYDGSGKSDDPNAPCLTLAGFAGSDGAWEEFKRLWEGVMLQWRYPRANDFATCSHIHMTDAYSLNGEFSVQRGWTKQKVNALMIELLNRCFSPMGYGPNNHEFCGASATLDLADYRRTCQNFRDLRKIKPPASLCVDYVVSIALAMLPQSATGHHGKTGSIDVMFDRNDEFQITLQPGWQNKKGYHRLINAIRNASAAEEVALQAADIWAWRMNRAYTNAEDGAFFLLAPSLSCPSYHCYFDYDLIVKRYKHALDLRN